MNTNDPLLLVVTIALLLYLAVVLLRKLHVPAENEEDDRMKIEVPTNGAHTSVRLFQSLDDDGWSENPTYEELEVQWTDGGDRISASVATQSRSRLVGVVLSKHPDHSKVSLVDFRPIPMGRTVMIPFWEVSSTLGPAQTQKELLEVRDFHEAIFTAVVEAIGN